MSNLRMACGYQERDEIPSESTFSRAFSEFARGGIGDIVHEALVKEHVGEQIVGHISRDSTAIEGNEKAAKKEARCWWS